MDAAATAAAAIVDLHTSPGRESPSSAASARAPAPTLHPLGPLPPVPDQPAEEPAQPAEEPAQSEMDTAGLFWQGLAKPSIKTSVLKERMMLDGVPVFEAPDFQQEIMRRVKSAKVGKVPKARAVMFLAEYMKMQGLGIYKDPSEYHSILRAMAACLTLSCDEHVATLGTNAMSVARIIFQEAKHIHTDDIVTIVDAISKFMANKATGPRTSISQLVEDFLALWPRVATADLEPAAKASLLQGPLTCIANGRGGTIDALTDFLQSTLESDGTLRDALPPTAAVDLLGGLGRSDKESGKKLAKLATELLERRNDARREFVARDGYLTVFHGATKHSVLSPDEALAILAMTVGPAHPAAKLLHLYCSKEAIEAAEAATPVTAVPAPVVPTTPAADDVSSVLSSVASVTPRRVTPTLCSAASPESVNPAFAEAPVQVKPPSRDLVQTRDTYESVTFDGFLKSPYGDDFMEAAKAYFRDMQAGREKSRKSSRDDRHHSSKRMRRAPVHESELDDDMTDLSGDDSDGSESLGSESYMSDDEIDSREGRRIREMLGRRERLRKMLPHTYNAAVRASCKDAIRAEKRHRPGKPEKRFRD